MKHDSEDLLSKIIFVVVVIIVATIGYKVGHYRGKYHHDSFKKAWPGTGLEWDLFIADRGFEYGHGSQFDDSKYNRHNLSNIVANYQ